MFRAFATCSALGLEINTGMKHRGVSTWQVANAISATLDVETIRAAAKAAGVAVSVPAMGTKRTKKGALEDLTLFLMIVWDKQPGGTVTRALGTEKVDALKRKAEKIVAVMQQLSEAQEWWSKEEE